MGKWVVKQPNGLYGIFSTVVDAFILMDANVDELRLDLLKMNYGLQDIERAIESADRDDYAGYQHGHRQTDGLARFREAMETIKSIHGHKKYKAYKRGFETGDWDEACE